MLRVGPVFRCCCIDTTFSYPNIQSSEQITTHFECPNPNICFSNDILVDQHAHRRLFENLANEAIPANPKPTFQEPLLVDIILHLDLEVAFPQ